MSKSFADILTLIHENNVEMINFKMADAKGEYYQVTIPAGSFSIDLIQKGINIDTETYSCVAANCGDAIFIPDMDSAVLDQGSIIPTVVISGALRYFSGDPVPVPTEKKKSNGKSFGIIALSCGGVALALLLVSLVLGCFCNIGVPLISSSLNYFDPYTDMGTLISTLCSIIAFGINLAVNAIVFVCGVIGIVFGVIGITRSKASGLSGGAAIAGLVVSIVSLVLWCFTVILPLIILATCIILIVIIYVFLFLYLVLIMIAMSAAV